MHGAGVVTVRPFTLLVRGLHRDDGTSIVQIAAISLTRGSGSGIRASPTGATATVLGVVTFLAGLLAGHLFEPLAARSSIQALAEAGRPKSAIMGALAAIGRR